MHDFYYSAKADKQSIEDDGRYGIEDEDGNEIIEMYEPCNVFIDNKWYVYTEMITAGKSLTSRWDDVILLGTGDFKLIIRKEIPNAIRINKDYIIENEDENEIFEL